MIEPAKFTNSPLEKGIRKAKSKTTEDQGKIETKFLNFSNTKYELKQVKDLFSDDQLTNLIKHRLKQIIKLQKSIKINDLIYSLTKKN